VVGGLAKFDHGNWAGKKGEKELLKKFQKNKNQQKKKKKNKKTEKKNHTTP